jgi:hypothetical protein
VGDEFAPDDGAAIHQVLEADMGLPECIDLGAEESEVHPWIRGEGGPGGGEGLALPEGGLGLHGREAIL